MGRLLPSHVVLPVSLAWVDCECGTAALLQPREEVPRGPGTRVTVGGLMDTLRPGPLVLALTGALSVLEVLGRVPGLCGHFVVCAGLGKEE